jgi:hypothetical protein
VELCGKVRIERPRQLEDDEWQCRFQIIGLLDDRVWAAQLAWTPSRLFKV